MKTSSSQRSTGSPSGRRPASPDTPAAALALIWMTGERVGQEYRLPADRAVIFGRSRQADIHLEDDLVSRRHTKIHWHNGDCVVEDLGSKNGTFLNGARLAQSAPLKAGDYLRIGESTFHAVLPCRLQDKAKSWWEQTQRTLATMAFPAARDPGAAPMISGSLAEVSLVDLLQLLANSRKTGCISLRGGRDLGEIFLRDGRIYYAAINQAPAARPEKTFLRILRWPVGVFTFTPGAERAGVPEITEPADALLLEGARLVDELSAFDHVLPPLDARLQLNLPLPVPLRECAPEELDVLQLVLEHGLLERVLDAHPGTDYDAVVILAGLLEKKLLVVAEEGKGA